MLQVSDPVQASAELDAKESSISMMTIILGADEIIE